MDRAKLRELLLDREQFTRLASFFVEKAAEEAERAEPNSSFARYLKTGLEIVIHETIPHVFERAESPIETIFINSLVLDFIKADPLNLVVTSTYSDAPGMIKEFREYNRTFKDFIKWYEDRRGHTNNIEVYLDEQMQAGRMDPTERHYLSKHLTYYHYLSLSNRFHLTLQAGMPDIKVYGKGIRADMLIWVPNEDRLGIVVECDGFEHHSDKDAFVADRRRDRALRAAGYEVLRYSGSEIHKDPIAASSDLFDYLVRTRRNGAV